MCDLARGLWTAHCKANVISVDDQYTLVHAYSVALLLVRQDELAFAANSTSITFLR